MLVAAFGAALALGVTALVAFEDPELAARATLERLEQAARTEVRGAWRLRLESSWPAEPRGPLVRAPARSAGRVAAPEPLDGTSPELGQGGGAGGEDGAFQTIWDSAHERERQGDVAGALELALQARELRGLDERETARLLVRRVQWAALVADGARARDAFRALVDAVGPRATIDRLPALVVAGLAVLPWLEPAARASEARRLVSAWRQGALALPDEPTRWTRSDAGAPRSEPGATLAYLRARLEALVPGSTAPLDAWFDARAARALDAWIGPLDVPAPGAWSFRRVGAHWFAWRRARAEDRPAGEPAGWRGAFFDESALIDGLARTLDERATLPEGFQLVVDLDPDEVRAAFGPGSAADPVELWQGGPRVGLVHAGLDALVAGEERRRFLARTALVLGALACAAAGLASARALRRERALAELKTRFVANVSHEVRTPLASILLLAENLEEGRASDRSSARYPTLIRREAARLRRLVDDVLDFSRLERGRPLEALRDDVALEPWLDGLADELRERAEASGRTIELERDLGVRVSGGDGAGRVAWIDAEALRRALSNLVDNALKHSGSERVDVRVAAVDGWLELAVRDHGRGLTARERERVFEPFVRLGDDEHGGPSRPAPVPSAPGTGLGLAIVREIARAHGGDAFARTPIEPGEPGEPGESGAGVELVVRVPLDPPSPEETT